MIKFAFAVVTLGIGALAAEVPLINIVPAEATVIGGIHVDKTISSSFGAYLLSQVNENDQHFREFVSATNFDPRHDLREVVFASTGQSKGPGVVVARGVFNGPQILAAVKAKSNGTQTTYNGVPLVEHAQGTRTTAVAVIDGSLAIAGDGVLVRAALDRRSGDAAAGALAGKAVTASSNYDAWVVTNGQYHPAAAAVPGAVAPGRRQTGLPAVSGVALQGVLETSGGVVFGSSVVRFGGQALTRSEKDAQALVDVVRFAAGMIQLNGGNNPGFQKLQPILDSLDVKATGTTVTFAASANESDLEQLMQPKRVRKTASVR